MSMQGLHGPTLEVKEVKILRLIEFLLQWFKKDVLIIRICHGLKWVTHYANQAVVIRLWEVFVNPRFPIFSCITIFFSVISLQLKQKIVMSKTKLGLSWILAENNSLVKVFQLISKMCKIDPRVSKTVYYDCPIVP